MKFFFKGSLFKLFKRFISFYVLRLLDVLSHFQISVEEGTFSLTLREQVAGLFFVALLKFIRH
jgi:hypothetical protein